MVLDRTKTGIFGRWWMTVDRVSLALLGGLILFGVVLVFAGSPPVAEKLGLDSFYFVRRQIFFLLLSVGVIVGVSMMDVVYVRRLAWLGFLIALLLMVVVPFIGMETKGARRWLMIAGMSIQPSEFLKPCMAVAVAWVLAQRQMREGFPAFRYATAMYAVAAFLLIMQPDFGMTVVVSSVWAAQMFLAGLPIFLVLGLATAGVIGVFGAYHLLSHVRHRIDRFLDPSTGDTYQVQKSLEALHHGGLFGTGPGEGKIKAQLPDSHTDYIFSVAGEELGAIACLVIVLFFGGLVLRMFFHAAKEKDIFSVLAVMGLATQFGVQAIINMGVAVNLLPSKGMTLPFLSYGGSSLVAVALGAGMMLAFTRRRYGREQMFLARGDRSYSEV
jgi:cell division protein FtsW